MKRVVLMVLILVCGSLPARINHHFEVIIPSYNNRQNMFDGEPVYKKNLMSVFSQTYTNYHVRYIDDASPDGTGFAVQELVKKLGYQDRVEVQINGASVGALCNRYLATHACDDRSIIVTLDGDDWLAHDRVLEQLNELYQDEDVWMTYGQFKRCCNSCIFVGAPQFYRNSAECQHSEEDDSICHPLPSRDVIDRNEMREYIRDHRPGHSWIFGALRTFYAGLFKKIQVQDLVSEGLFYGIGEDTAVTIYMVEMAGHHVRFVSDISYIYNNALRIPSGRDIIRPIFWLEEMAVRRKYEPIQSPLSQNPVQMDVVDILAHYYSRVAVQEYYMNNFYGSIAASRNALLLKLKDANAYANICAAYNALGRAEDALMAGEMAVMLDSALPAARKHLEQARALQVAVQEGARDYSY